MWCDCSAEQEALHTMTAEASLLCVPSFLALTLNNLLVYIATDRTEAAGMLHYQHNI